MTIHWWTDLKVQRQIETSLNIWGEPSALEPHLLLIKEAVLDTLWVNDWNDEWYNRTIDISKLSQKIQRVINAKTLQEIFELLDREDLYDNFDLKYIYKASKEMANNPLFSRMCLEVSLRYLLLWSSYSAALFFPIEHYDKYYHKLYFLRENKEEFNKLANELRREYSDLSI